MERPRRGTGGAAAVGTALVGVRHALRAVFRSRDRPLSAFSDRQLADIGLTRADVARPHERTASAELQMQRLLQGRGWR